MENMNPVYNYYNEDIVKSFKYGKELLETLFYKDKYTVT